MTSLTGLTESEVLALRRGGKGNTLKTATSRSYRDIIASNVLNPINLLLFAIGAVMVAIGRASDAITSAGLILLNVVIGLHQEIRAKRQLDRIALLTRPRVTVRRAGQERSIDPAEIVQGDLIVASEGDQLVADGVILEGSIEADESALSGEADAVLKNVGDELLSGSFVLSGSAVCEVTRVGGESFANKLTATARQYELSHTPMQREISLLLKLLTLLAGFIGGATLIGTILSQTPLMRQVQMAAIIAGLVPNGLFFMVILAYAMGALRIAGYGALVQQANAVESLANVTLLCADKTGTLTANQLRYHDVFAVNVEKETLKRLLGDLTRSLSTRNKTSEALIAGLPGQSRPIADEVPFSSARKWSALAFADTGGVYVLGAAEMLDQHLPIPEEAQRQIETWMEQGLRVLAFAQNLQVTRLHDAPGEILLPQLTLLGLVSLSDELRPQLKATLAEFARAGIALKIISGDSPTTVAALVRQAGVANDLRAISGPDLAALDEAGFQQAAVEYGIFGRIIPAQKERLVEALRTAGYYVAMIGDGVNDVLALKQADMGIAMESGSAATRAVADMILLGDSFAALPPAFREGQRIINGMRDILRLFLTRVLYAALLIIAVAIIGLGFPFIPAHNAILVLLTVGAPTLALSIWARPGPLSRGSILREVAHFALPAAATITLFGLGIYIAAFRFGVQQAESLSITPEAIASFQRYSGINYDISAPSAYILEVAQLVAQSALTSFLVLAGILLIVFVEPPIPWFAAGDELSRDRRPTILAGVMLVAYMLILALEPLRHLFELVALPPHGYAGIALVTLAWMLLLRQAWRGRWLQRFLGVVW